MQAIFSKIYQLRNIFLGVIILALLGIVGWIKLDEQWLLKHPPEFVDFSTPYILRGPDSTNNIAVMRRVDKTVQHVKTFYLSSAVRDEMLNKDTVFHFQLVELGNIQVLIASSEGAVRHIAYYGTDSFSGKDVMLADGVRLEDQVQVSADAPQKFLRIGSPPDALYLAVKDNANFDLFYDAPLLTETSLAAITEDRVSAHRGGIVGLLLSCIVLATLVAVDVIRSKSLFESRGK